VAAADQLCRPNQFGEIVESQGGVGLERVHGPRRNDVFLLIPGKIASNSGLTSSPERFLEPVMRQFYKERDVVYEERRMSVDSSPQGRPSGTVFCAAALSPTPMDAQ